MPTVPVPTDPRLAAALARCRALRVELDRLDVAVDALDIPGEALDRALVIREQLDQIEADIELQAATQ